MNVEIAIVMAIAAAVIAYQIRNDAKESNGQFLFVTIPDYAKMNGEYQRIKTQYYREQKRQIIAITLGILPILFLNGFMSMTYLLLWMALAVVTGYAPMRKYRRQLLDLKAEKKWLGQSSKYIRTDLKLTVKMQNYQDKTSRFILPLGLNTLTFFLAFRDRQWALAGCAVLMIGLLLSGCWWLFHLSNETYGDDHELNLKLNRLRRGQFQKAWSFLTMADALFLLGVTIFLLKQLSFWLLLCLMIAVLFLTVEGIAAILHFQRTKNSLLNNHQISLGDDMYWKVGLLGPVYYHPYDPRLFVNSPNGMQMILNHAKPGAKWFYYGIVAFIIILLAGIYGYPYYLDQTHALSCLAIENDQLHVSGPFYEKTIDLDEIIAIDWTDDLGNGKRILGTSTMIYQKGHYYYDRYGDCELYVAGLHESYLIITTKEGIYIVNDDREERTKEIYEEILERVVVP